MKSTLLTAALAATTLLGTSATGANVAHAATTTSYTVRASDTLSAIARSHATTAQAIATASGISRTSTLRVGQVLRIPATAAVSAVSASATRTVIAKRIIGRSVKGRAIVAYLVGDPTATRTEMVLGNMHGNEPKSDDTAWAIINGPRVKGIKLWVVPTMNPDGLAAGVRTNAHGVDLNHNFADHWTHTAKGRYYSGAKPMSEPESRAILGFVATIRPQYLVSLHQPYAAVDNERVKSRVLQKALSKNLGLPIKWTGASKDVSHGTFVGQVNAQIAPTAAITVEFSANPSRWFLVTKARVGIVKAVGGSY